MKMCGKGNDLLKSLALHQYHYLTLMRPLSSVWPKDAHPNDVILPRGPRPPELSQQSDVLHWGPRPPGLPIAIRHLTQRPLTLPSVVVAAQDHAWSGLLYIIHLTSELSFLHHNYCQKPEGPKKGLSGTFLVHTHPNYPQIDTSNASIATT